MSQIPPPDIREQLAKLPPSTQDKDIELRVLGHLMRAPEDVQKVESEWFTIPLHRTIYNVMKELIRKGFDAKDVQAIYMEAKELDSSIISDDIINVYTSFTEFRNPLYYIKKLEQRFIKDKNILEPLSDIIELAHDSATINIRRLDTFIRKVQFGVSSIHDVGDPQHTIYVGEDMSNRYLAEIRAREENQILRTIGCNVLNAKLGRPAATGDIYTLMGESGSGKSIFSLYLENCLVDQNVCVVKLSPEMSFASNMDRLMALRHNYSTAFLQEKKTERQLQILASHVNSFTNKRRYAFNDNPTVSIDQVNRYIDKARGKFLEAKTLPSDGYMVVVIDLLTMLKDFGDLKPQTIEQAMNSLHKVIKAQGVFCLGVGQTNENRMREARFDKMEDLDRMKLTISDIKNGAAFKERSRVVMIVNRPMLWKQQYFPENEAVYRNQADIMYIDIAKQNEGRLSRTAYLFDTKMGYSIGALEI